MAATWTLVNGGPFSTLSVQIGTESAPTLSTEGMNLDGVMALTVWLDAGSGQTITADVGQADIYVYDNAIWGLAPAIVLSVPPGSSGKRRIQLGTLTVDNQRGRLAPILNGVTVSGATATVEILVTLDRTGRSRAA